MDFINIIKKPLVKNCIRINKEEDIPDFLKSSIKIVDDLVILDCLEGEEKVPIGSVIAFEKLENGKINVWNKANWESTTKEIDGIFYEKPKVVKAIALNEIDEDLIKYMNIKVIDGEYELKTDWGVSKCNASDGYLVIYGINNDKVDANILNKNTPSFREYYVIDEEGNMISSLEEYDKSKLKTKK